MPAANPTKIKNIFYNRSIPAVPLQQGVVNPGSLSSKPIKDVPIRNVQMCGKKSKINGRLAQVIADAIDANGHFIDDQLDTANRIILGTFTFGNSGALTIGTYVAGVSGEVKISPNGIVSKDKDNDETFALDGTTGQITAMKLIAGSADIGGWKIGATGLYYDGATDAESAGLSVVDYPFYAGAKYADRAAAPFRVGTDGSVVCDDITINGGSISAAVVVGIISSGNINVADRGWIQTCDFSSVDNNTVAWGAGQYIASDGTVYNIGAGNTGNMAAKTYIYLDIALSLTAYQHTTNAATASGDGKRLIAIAQNHAHQATFQVFDGSLRIDGDAIADESIVAGKLSITDLSDISTVLGSIMVGYGNIDVASLDLISDDLGTITDGAMSGVDISGGYLFIAGNQLNASADTERTDNQVAYTKIKEIKITRGGEYRTKFDYKGADAINAVFARVYKNGVAVGTERTKTSDSYSTISQDIAGLAAGDLIQIYAKTADAATAYFIKNFQLYVADCDQPVVNLD